MSVPTAILIIEAQTRGFDPELLWAQREPFSEHAIMWERRRLIGDCAATLLLSDYDLVDLDRRYIANLVEATFLRPRIWGYGAVPAYIVRYWATCRVQAGSYIDYAFAQNLSILLASCQDSLPGVTPLPSPYYSFQECWALGADARSLSEDEGIFDDSFENHAWFARAVLFMLAKRNLKQTCKSLWPSFSRPLHVDPHLPPTTFFDSLLSPEGTFHMLTVRGKKWTDFVMEAIEEDGGDFLDPFSPLAWLVAAYVAIVPYRAWTGVVMWLDRQLNLTWYRKEHLPDRS